MPVMIEVQPAARLLRDFARWATVQTPKVRTVSQHAFAVPVDLFGDIPEAVLAGAVVDGQRYASPHDHASAELLGVATPAAFSPTGDPAADAAAMVAATSPGLVERAMSATLAAADLAASNQAVRDEPADDEHDQAHDDGQGGDAEPYACDLCTRAFGTERGRDTHRRQAHPED